MGRDLAVILLCAMLLAMPTTTAIDAENPEERQRVVVDTGSLSDEELRDGAAAGEGDVLRVDETLGFAVLELERPAAFADETGVSPTTDERGGGSATTPLGEVTDDPYYASQWGPSELNAPQAWGVSGSSVRPTIGIVDSGIDASHPDLGPIWIEMGHDYVEDDEDPQDEHGHGTHVAGIVSAARDNGEGIAGMVHAALFVTRVFDEDNLGWCSDFASGIREAVDAGVDVVNFSGHCGGHNAQLHEAIAYAWSNDVPVVVSAGNTQLSDPSECVRHPAVHSQAIAVAATDPTLTPAYYSCQGPEIELAAPGSFVMSTVPGGYNLYSGTSMAAPHVTATVAMLLDQDPSLTPSEVRDRLNGTARDLGEPGHDPAFGHGMVDPVAALTGLPAWDGGLAPD